MKKLDVILRAAAIVCLAGSLVTGCDDLEDAVSLAGKQVDEENLTGRPSITFRAAATIDNVVKVNLPEGGDFTSVKVFAQSNKPLDGSQTLLLEEDESLVEAYSRKMNTEYTLLPAPFFKIDNGGALVFPEGANESEQKLIRIYATNPLGNVLEAGRYLLPVRAKSSAQQVYDDVLYIDLTIQAPFSGRPELYTGDDCFTVFYLNTGVFDPRLVTEFVVEKRAPKRVTLWHNAIGNIVNFRTVTVDYDNVSGRPILNFGKDLRYLCNNYDTYFKPVKDTGRKLCLCIEGGNKGIGFCNMDDAQIADFVYQVKQVIGQYGFDGVNLWDRNSGYGMEGMPEMNTFSYPRLIVALRKALGPYKLITVTDYKEPTEYFWDVDAMDGIEVGKYLDYAWAGYVNGDEPIQIIDPYHQGEEYVSTKYPRKPIAGLSPKRYGPIHTTWYELAKSGYDDVAEWVKQGFRQSNISVYYDIRSNLQDKYEGQIYTPDVLLTYLDETALSEGTGPNVYLFDIENFDTSGSGYGKWLKDW